MQNTHRSIAFHMPPAGDLAHNPGMYPGALAGNRTGDLSVHRPVLNPLSHTSQGSLSFFLSSFLSLSSCLSLVYFFSTKNGSRKGKNGMISMEN